MRCLYVPQCLITLPRLDVLFSLPHMIFQRLIRIIKLLLVHPENEVPVRSLPLLSSLSVLVSKPLVPRGFHLLQTAHSLQLVVELPVPEGPRLRYGRVQHYGLVLDLYLKHCLHFNHLSTYLLVFVELIDPH